MPTIRDIAEPTGAVDELVALSQWIDAHCDLGTDRSVVAEPAVQAVRTIATHVLARVAELVEVREARVPAVRAERPPVVPTSWLDPILTGPAAVVGKPPYGCPEVEAILNAVRLRASAALLVEREQGALVERARWVEYLNARRRASMSVRQIYFIDECLAAGQGG